LTPTADGSAIWVAAAAAPDHRRRGRQSSASCGVVALDRAALEAQDLPRRPSDCLEDRRGSNSIGEILLASVELAMCRIAKVKAFARVASGVRKHERS